MKSDNYDYNNQNASISILKRLYPYLHSMRYRILLSLFLLVLAKLASVGSPLVLKDIIDSLDSKNIVLILPLGLLISYGGLWLFSSLFNELRDAVFAKVRYRAMRLISVNVFKHLHNLEINFHLDRKIGGISRDIDRGAQSTSTLLSILVFNILPSILEVLLITGILLFNYDIFFVFVSLTTVTIYLILTFMITTWRMKYRYEMNDMDSIAQTCAIDSLINYETVKCFSNEEFEFNRYEGIINKWEKIAIKTFTSMTILNFAQGSIIVFGVTVILILAAQGVVDGVLSLGDLILIQTLLLQLFLPLGTLGMVYRQIKHNLIDMNNLFKLLDTKITIQDKPNAKPIVIKQCSVDFVDVSFSYPNGTKVLNNISFNIEPKQKLAIVGASGVGKSTIARLLFRFYDIDNGKILIDGQNIAEITQDSLRKQIAIVPQDAVMFNETILYNIKYGSQNASMQEIEQVVKATYLEDFINKLPDGYETKVGERGLKLSGGEKQRLAIARLLLKKPKLFIFDEATSSLDSYSEKIVLNSIKSLQGQSTMLVIAHRLSTIIDADKIIVLDKDGVLEYGTHRELIAKNSEYSKLWNLQIKEKTINKDSQKKAIPPKS